jgi:hypothetical protein
MLADPETAEQHAHAWTGRSALSRSGSDHASDDSDDVVEIERPA